jgi:predicted PurR-regulated permease PerM
MAAFGLEFAVFWAIIIALLNYIPYIGSFIGVAFPIAMAILQFDGAENVLALLVALVTAQVVMGNVIEPQVMGNSLNLSPYVILVSLTAWSALWGVSGAIVSVPITAVMVIVLSEFSSTRPIAVLLSKNGDVGIGR